MMTNQQFYTAVEETASYIDRDAYISDLAISSMLGDDAPVPAQRIAELAEEEAR